MKPGSSFARGHAAKVFLRKPWLDQLHGRSQNVVLLGHSGCIRTYVLRHTSLDGSGNGESSFRVKITGLLPNDGSLALTLWRLHCENEAPQPTDLSYSCWV